MRITALIENTSHREDVGCEHGLSLYIETGEHRILFDMGQTDRLLRNAETLGVDLSSVTIAVLSHGHYDHGGGLAAFLSVNSSAPVYIHRRAFDPHYNGTQKYIGLDTSLIGHSRLVYTDDYRLIAEGLELFSCNDRPVYSAPPPSGLTERVGDDFIPDDFRHEQYLLVNEGGRRILISGCSHKGIINIARWFSPDALVGGFHLSKLPLDSSLAEAASELASLPTQYYTCHCTGVEQFEFMGQHLPRLGYLSCGQTLNI